MKFKIALVLLILFGVNSLSAKPILINGMFYNLSSNEPYTAEVTYNDKHKYKGSIVIPSKVYFDGHYYSVTSIGSSAFYDCDGLTSITIPKSVKTIGDNAFDLCSGLTSITIPNSVTSIGKDAFSCCSSLTSIEIPNSVTTIKIYAFWGCRGLKSITIPNSVTTIGDNAFAHCTGLTSVTIPNSVTSIGEDAFKYCEGLKKTNYTGTIADWCKIKFGEYNANPIYYSNNLFINGVEVKDLVIPEGVDTIGNYAFYKCSGLTSITIPNSVTTIGKGAFDCVGLKKTNYTGTIADWCKIKFGSYHANPIYCSHNLFINGVEVKDLVIPNSVISIGVDAFYNCDGLTSITIPNSVTSIGEAAFFDCNKLISISVAKDNPNYDSRNKCNAIIETKSNKLIVGCKNTIIPNSVTAIGDYAFYNCEGLTSITIPNSVISIGDYTFDDCDGLTSIAIPNSVTSIGKSAFFSCSKLTSIIIPNSVTLIGERAFSWCSKLTSITIPHSVTAIGEEAFDGCSKLTSITIPHSVTSIGKDAFEYCDQLTDLYVPRHLDISKIGIDKKKTKIHYLPKVTPSLSIIADSIRLIGTRQSSTLGAEENATLRIPIVNTGKGNANDIVVSLSVKGATDGVQFHDTTHVGTIISNNRRTITIPISTTPWTTTGSLQLTITAKTVGSSATANYTISTSALVPPLVEISGWQFSSSDDVLQKKQPFKLQYTIRNSGQGRAKGVHVILQNTSSLTLLDGSNTQNCALLPSAEEQTYMCEYVSSAQTSDSISLMINLTESYGKYAKNAVIPIVFGKTPCTNTSPRHSSIADVHIESIDVVKHFEQVSGTTISLTHAGWHRKYYKPNASEGKKMPYAMFKVKFTGNSESIRWGKELVRMDLGNIYVVKDLERNIDNELWFLIPVEAQYIDLTCGDGCQPISIWQGKLTPNGVYEGEIECKISK